jgi:hypothetical protein
MDAVQELRTQNDQTALKEEAEWRMFSPRPFDREEILQWVDKLKASYEAAGIAFVNRLSRAPAFTEIQTGDPELAKVLMFN